MISVESRDIRGAENMHLSRVIYYGNSVLNIQDKVERVHDILVKELGRKDFKLIESYDNKKDLLIVPQGIKALKELRDKVFTITDK